MESKMSATSCRPFLSNSANNLTKFALPSLRSTIVAPVNPAWMRSWNAWRVYFQDKVHTISSSMLSPKSSGCPAPRERVLDVAQSLINLNVSHVYLCITSRSEIDIRDILEPLAVHVIPLRQQAGQNQDIADYINDRVRSDPMMQQWREEDKQMVIETLTRKAGGM